MGPTLKPPLRLADHHEAGDVTEVPAVVRHDGALEPQPRRRDPRVCGRDLTPDAASVCPQLSELLCHLKMERSHCETPHLATKLLQTRLAPAPLIGALEQFGDGLKREHCHVPFDMPAVAVGERVRIEDVREDVGVDEDRGGRWLYYGRFLSPKIASRNASTSSGSSMSDGSGKV